MIFLAKICSFGPKQDVTEYIPYLRDDSCILTGAIKHVAKISVGHVPESPAQPLPILTVFLFKLIILATDNNSFDGKGFN